MTIVLRADTVLKVPIEQVTPTKCLGVIFDDRLEWSTHITYINTKIGSRE